MSKKLSHSVFRQFWGFFVAAFKSTFRNPSAVFFGFFFPLIFIFSFAFFDSGSVNFDLGFIPSNSKEYDIFKNAVESSKVFKVEEGGRDNLNRKLERASIDAIVEVNKNRIIVTTNNSKPQNNPIILQYLSTIVDKVSLGDKEPIYNIEERGISGRTGKYIDFVLPGVLGFSLLTAAISATSFSFVSLKNTKALKRLFATPAKSGPFILGQTLARLIFSLIQNVILLVVAIGLFNYQPRGGFLSVLQMILVIIVGLIAFLGMGYIVAGISKNEDQVAPITNVLTLPQFLLAGTFFPVSNLPGWLQSIAKVLPLYNFNEAMRSISLDGLSINHPDVAIQLAYLGIWIVVIYFIASKVFSVKLND